VNIDTGEIKPWEDLTDEDKRSGKWVPVNRHQRRAAAAEKRREARKAARRQRKAA